MFAKLKKLFYKYFDYDIVGNYYDTSGDGHYQSKHMRKYYLKSWRKKHKKRGGHR